MRKADIEMEIPRPMKQVLPLIARTSLSKNRSNSLTQQLDNSKTSLLSKYADDDTDQKIKGKQRNDPQTNANRAQTYQRNQALMIVEKENFEKLKRDVAAGRLVLDVSCSDDSSAIPSPFEKTGSTQSKNTLTQSEFKKELFRRIQHAMRDEKNWGNEKNVGHEKNEKIEIRSLRDSARISLQNRAPIMLYSKSASVSKSELIKKKSISRLSAQYGGV